MVDFSLADRTGRYIIMDVADNNRLIGNQFASPASVQKLSVG